jgi:hypothetical protein
MDQAPDGPDLQRAIREIGVERIGSMVLCSYRPDETVPGRDQPFRPSEDVERWLAEATRRLRFDQRPTYADRNCAVLATRANGVAASSP